MARVIIAIPCYGQEVFLFECLNSLLAQTMTDWEAVVVDDCSPGGHAETIVANYNDLRIRYIRHAINRGLAASRNTAIGASVAPFVLCLDADDFLHPDYLSVTLSGIEKHKADIAFADFQLVGLSNDIWKFSVRSMSELSKDQWIPGAGTLMQRTVWEKACGYCDAPELRIGNEDWDFWIGVAENGFTAIQVDRPLYYYRRHAATMSVSRFAPEEWKTREYIVRRHPSFFAEKERAKLFLSAGYFRSAAASRRLGRRSAAIRLLARAITLDPGIAAREGNSFIRGSIRRIKRLGQKNLKKYTTAASRVTPAVSVPNQSSASQKDWDIEASKIHDRYGHLSHDYLQLGEIIRQAGIGSVLEIGCGTGRLFPVYLLHELHPIWGQDISPKALEICSKRFRHQSQIKYIDRPVQELPPECKVDMIVSNRVLQHILDDAELRRSISLLASRTDRIYLNERGPDDGEHPVSPFIKSRDYGPIFEELRFRLESSGILWAEGGQKQVWKLFKRNSVQ